MTWRLLPLAVRVKRLGWPGVWLPLFLLWPLILLLFCLALPFTPLLASSRASGLTTLAASYHLLCAVHGTEVEFGTDPKTTWTFSLY